MRDGSEKWERELERWSTVGERQKARKSEQAELIG
jgi:hypothetical protein